MIFLIFQVYPTTTRALGLGMCSGMARIGALVTPFFAQVSFYELKFMTLQYYKIVHVPKSVQDKS